MAHLQFFILVGICIKLFDFVVYFFGGLECVGHSFSDVAHFVFLRYVWIRGLVIFRINTPETMFISYRELLTTIGDRFTDEDVDDMFR